MQFHKPPVVEVWISFEFDPSPKKIEWDKNLLRLYVQQLSAELPLMELTHERTIQVKPAVDPTDLPKVTSQESKLQFVSMTNKAKSDFVRIGDDQIGFHLQRTADRIPRFTGVKEFIGSKVADYISLFEPACIRHVGVHYLDIIEIPVPLGERVYLTDYFHIIGDLPEDPFGLMRSLGTEVQMDCPTDPGPLLLRLQSLASTAGRNLKFRLEWHKQSTDVNTLDVAHAWRRMDKAHTYLQECFRRGLKPKTLDLFDPYEE